MSSEGVIAFTAVPEATSYKAYVYNSDMEKVYEQVVANGGTINYHPYLTDTYKVYLQALGADNAYSAVSAPVDWELEGNIAYLPTSDWCTRLYKTTANESEDVNVTWSTDKDGNIKVILSPVEGNTQTEPTIFRGAMNVDNLKIGETSLSTYFNSSYSDNVNTFELKNPNVKPTYGTTITYKGQVVYKTGTHSNAWPDMYFEYIYGTTCSGYNDHTNPVISDFSVVSKDIHAVTFHVAATDEDDLGASHDIATYEISSNNNGFVTTAVTPDENGNFTVSGLVSNGVYTFALRAIDAMGNEASVNSEEITLPLDPDFNLARGKSAVAGKTQDDYTANKGCDGNEGTMWSSYGTDNQSQEWWYVDLGRLYTIRQVKIKWMNDYSKHFLIQGVAVLPEAENVENDEAWTTYLDYTYTSDPQMTTQNHDVVGKMRYLRLKSLENEQNLGIEFYELEVYGSDYAEADDVAPVIGTTSCETDTEEATATLTLTANDAIDGTIKDFYISCATYEMTETKYTTNGSDQITITDLETYHDYTFHVRCRDLSGNWAETDVVAHFTISAHTNVALHKNTTSGRDEGDYISGKAVDGNTSTRWGNYYNGEFEESMNMWQVDLSNAYLVNRIQIYWAQNGCPNDNEGGYIISASLNGADYTTLVEGAKYEGDGENENNYLREHLITGDAANTPFRYVRIQSKNVRFMSFNEFEVYATEEIPLLSLDEASDNTSVLAAYDGQTCMVTLNRTFAADNLYTLVLPFDVDAAQMAAKLPGTMTKLDGVRKKANEDMYLNFVDVSSMEAGVAYLYTPSRNVTNPVFENVVVKEDLKETTYTQDDYSATFKGIYDATSDVKATLDQSTQGLDNYVLGSDQWLYQVSSMSEIMAMNAFRGYFTLNFGANAAPGRRARVVFGDIDDNPMATDLEELDNKQLPDKRIENGQLLIIRNGHTYNAQGQLLR